jgi:hypothetical protein
MSSPESITISGHELIAYTTQLRLLVNGQPLPSPHAVHRLNRASGKRWSARRWLKILEPAYDHHINGSTAWQQSSHRPNRPSTPITKASSSRMAGTNTAS